MNVIGMNLRNYVIARVNDTQAQRLAKDKVALKKHLEGAGIRVPETLCVIRTVTQAKKLLELTEDFVIKPDHGFAGRGILVLAREQDGFRTPGGRRLELHDIKFHIEKILEGQYSGLAENDYVLVEKRIMCSKQLQFKEAIGLPDIRIICEDNLAIACMIRYPTSASEGKANLAQGAIGFGVDLPSGRIVSAYSEIERRFYELEEWGVPKDFRLPARAEIIDLAQRAAGHSGLRYAGVDIVLDQADEPVVLEVNGYPGLEIQNVLRTSLLELSKDAQVRRRSPAVHEAQNYL